MKYFIDFEATQFSGEIISVGAVREDGETFYALVAPVKGKITPFITNLTGITAEMIDTAMSSDNVFEMFYDWAFASDETPDFFVWGGSDVDFVRHTFKRTNSFKARLSLGYLAGSIRDYSVKFSKETKIKDKISLLKALQIFEPEATQNHNSLDDAVMLKKLYDYTQMEDKTQIENYLQNTKTIEEEVKREERVRWNKAGLPVGTVCICHKKTKYLKLHFPSVEDAANYISVNGINGSGIGVDVGLIIKGINGSIHHGRQYFGYQWHRVIEVKKDENLA